MVGHPFPRQCDGLEVMMIERLFMQHPVPTVWDDRLPILSELFSFGRL
jgi:hypothetical protein